ncbi:hypothetical protein D9619_008429 [Psilocybe cf. subviscida]|uniref:Uncharacterized protein n=1 Tax=Psilocybe cf. subviscida TaxID=2480587 RepID=A0A8H5F0N3_9AGAR|nr:hypothetical protein D9619_008429 [Psilocybe cf. subviscida]
MWHNSIVRDSWGYLHDGTFYLTRLDDNTIQPPFPSTPETSISDSASPHAGHSELTNMVDYETPETVAPLIQESRRKLKENRFQSRLS